MLVRISFLTVYYVHVVIGYALMPEALNIGRPFRVGVIGYGFIGQEIVARLRADPKRFALAFVHARRREQAADIPDTDFLDDLTGADLRGADLVVETAHPVITQRHGAHLLRHCDYLPLSTSALTDDVLRETLISTAKEHGTRLLLGAGALIGGEEMVKRSVPWARARITFRKNPKNIDFSDVDIDPASITEATTIFDGSVREIARRYPRNVNTMVTAALLSTGVDACEGALVADPALDCAIAEVEAWGEDGSYIRTEKRQPAKGVSGTEMVDSVWASICRGFGVTDAPLVLV